MNQKLRLTPSPPNKRITQTSEIAITDIQMPGHREWVRPVWVGLGVAVLVLLLWWSDLFVQTRLRLTDVLFVPREPTGDVEIIAADRESRTEKPKEDGNKDHDEFPFFENPPVFPEI